MDSNNTTTSQDDKVILEVRYSEWLSTWLLGLFVMLVGCMMVLGAYTIIPKGTCVTYIKGCFVLVCGIACFLLAADTLLTERIVFFQNRIVKHWCFLGHRTIYYGKAQVNVAPPYLRRLRNGYWIMEIRDNGSPVLMQIPIYYNAHLVTPAAVRNVSAIFDFLMGGIKSGTHKLVNTVITEEDVCRAITGQK